MAVSYVDRQAVSALAPTITKELGIGDTAFGWLGSAFSMAYLAFAPLAGRLVDRVGSRRALVGSVLAWSAVAALHALVPGFAVLFALRILLGATEAPSFPGAAQAVARVLPARARHLGFGVLFTGSSVGAALSAALAPALAARFGWRGALLGTALVGLAWLPLWFAVTAPAAARAALAPVTPPTPGPDTPPPPSFSWAALLRDRDVQLAVLAVLGSAPIGGTVFQFGAKILVNMHGLTQAEVGSWLWMPPLALDAGAVGFGALLAVTGRPGLPFAGAALLSLGIGGLAVSGSPLATTVAFCLAMAGGGGIYAIVTSDLLRRVGADRVATAGGVLAAAQSLALIVAFPLVGAVVEATGSYRDVAIGLVGFACVAFAGWGFAPRPARGAG